MSKKRLAWLFKVPFIIFLAILAMTGLTFAAITFDTWNRPLQGGDALTVGHVNDFYGILQDLLDIITESDGNLAIGGSGVSPGLKLDVEGKVGAEAYCDKDGQNCFTHANLQQDFSIPCELAGTVVLETERRVTSNICYNCCQSGYECAGTCRRYETRDLQMTCDGARINSVSYSGWTLETSCTCDGTCYEYVVGGG